MNEAPKPSQRRLQFLKIVYRLTGNNSGCFASVEQIAAEMLISSQDAFNIFDLLKQAGLIETIGIEIQAKITYAGIKEIEEAERTATQPKDTTATGSLNIQTAIGGVFQVGTIGSTQQATVSVNAFQPEHLLAWLNNLKQELPNLPLADAEANAVRNSIAAIEIEAYDPEPSNDFLNKHLTRIREILGSIGTHMAADTLLKGLTLAAQHYHLLGLP